jgi:hypothetical protein
MSALKNRLKAVEAKLKPPAIEQLIIKITRAGCSDNPVSWRHHTTGEIFHHDSDTSHLKGVNLMMAVY